MGGSDEPQQLVVPGRWIAPCWLTADIVRCVVRHPEALIAYAGSTSTRLSLKVGASPSVVRRWEVVAWLERPSE